MEKPKRRRSPAAGLFSGDAEPRAAEEAPKAKAGAKGGGLRAALPGFFSALKITPALIKTMAFTLGLLAIGIVGLNWDSISRAPEAQPDISPSSLADPVSPLAQRTPDFPFAQPASWSPAAPWAEYFGPIYAAGAFALTETFSWTPYVVLPGDTISGIAARHSVSQESIIALNGIRESWNLQIGRTLKIPNMNGIPYTVGEGDTIGDIAQRMNIPQNVLLDANDIYRDIVPGQVLFIPGGRMDAGELRRAILRAPERPMIRPVPGRITSGFGWREDPFHPGSGRMELHRAVDLAGRTGDPIRAAMRGTVFHRGANPILGNFIILQHEGFQTLYAHLSAFSVATGETVRQGQEIGRIGSTGRATGPHLHFAVFQNGEPVNPVDLWR